MFSEEEVLEPESISNNTKKSTIYRSTSIDRGSPEESEQEYKRRTTRLLIDRDELLMCLLTVVTGLTGEEALLNLRVRGSTTMDRGVRCTVQSIDRPWY
jgi:hypothetical protein